MGTRRSFIHDRATRWPRRTIRLRLTALFAGLFFISGVALLAITYVLVVHATNGFVFQGQNGGTASFEGHDVGSVPSPNSTVTSTAAGNLTDEQLAAQARQLNAQASQQHTDELHQLFVQSAIALAIMLVVSTALGWIVAGRALRPIRLMTAAARRISEDNLQERLAVPGPSDELKDLGDTIDGLLTRLEASFDSQRRFIANASHELRTPLTLTKALLQMTLADPNATVKTMRATCKDVLVAEEQQESLIEALLTLARSQRGLDQRQPVDLAAIVSQTVVELQPEADRRVLSVDAVIRPVAVSGDPRLLQRLVSNLLSNALRYNTADGYIEVSVDYESGSPTLRIGNTGPHIPEVELERVLQPFQRGRSGRTGDSDGLGLGLSIVAAIANAHGATLRLTPRIEGGLEVEVVFPSVSETPAMTGDAVDAVGDIDDEHADVGGVGAPRAALQPEAGP
jgi:signal transduction histidine kinase